MAPQQRRRLRRSPAIAAVAAIASIMGISALVAACSPIEGPTAPGTGPGASAPAASDPTAPEGNGAAGCETGAFPGWPTPGQVTTRGIIPVLASSERLVGTSRLLFVLVDGQNRPIADETLEVEIAFFDLCSDPTAATEVLTPSFEWGVVGERAFYIVTPELTAPGAWGAAVAVRDPATGSTTGAKLQFSVSEGGFGPRIGDPAPAVRTPALGDVGGDVRRISSDPDPEPSFYETSLDAALDAHEPFLVAFVTPGFCQSAQCGPTMEVVKAVVRDAPVRVVAIEPYELKYDDGRLQPLLQEGSFVPVAAANAFGIPTEPWLFVVDADGTITASFEAVVGEQELADAIRAVTTQGIRSGIP